MIPDRADIIADLQRQILPLEGFKPLSSYAYEDIGLGAIKEAFPNNEFPFGAIHEFMCSTPEDKAATSGFVAGMLSSMMRRGGHCIWVSPVRMIFPPALSWYGIDAERIVFIEVQKEKERLWVIEEALKCDGLCGVIGEVQDLSYMASRRLQLAVEQSRVTGFIFRLSPRNINTTACIARWKIGSLSGALTGSAPGLGFPRWQVELLKVRNGRTGSWQIEWAVNRFKHVPAMKVIEEEQQRKAG